MDDFLAQRYGWTFSELDEEDMSRVLPAIASANIYAALGRVNGWMNAAGGGQNVALPGEHDLQVWQAVTEAQKHA